MDLRELKEKSIHLSGGRVTVCWPQYNEEENLDLSDMRSKFNNSFAMNNSTICYIDDNEIFVTPYTREGMQTIVKAGLTQDYFYVPFSNWDYPKYEKEKWENLRASARESYLRDYEKDSTEWCEEHGIEKLDDEILKQCFRIPPTGVPVKHPHYETIVYPACNESSVDCTVIDKLGRYCTNNGRVAFVCCDGHTYVAKGYKIIDHLREAGYKEGSLFVPFSNGERIVDPILADQWEQIPKN